MIARRRESTTNLHSTTVLQEWESQNKPSKLFLVTSPAATGLLISPIQLAAPLLSYAKIFQFRELQYSIPILEGETHWASKVSSSRSADSRAWSSIDAWQTDWTLNNKKSRDYYDQILRHFFLSMTNILVRHRPIQQVQLSMSSWNLQRGKLMRKKCILQKEYKQ